MKVLKIILVILLIVVFAAVGGAYFFIKNLDLNKYKGQIATQLGAKLQTEVKIGDIDFNFDFKTGLALNIKNIRFADQGLLAGIGIDIEEVQLAVSLEKYLKERSIVVEAIKFREPVIHYDIGKKKQADMAVRNNFSHEKKTGAITKNDFTGKLQINSVRITGGEVVIASDGKMLAQDLEFKNIDAVVKDMVLGQTREAMNGNPHAVKPFSFQLSTSALGADKFISVDGEGRIDMMQQQMRLDDVKIQTDMDQVDLNQLTATVVPLAGLGLTELEGKLELIVSQMILGPAGVPVLTFKGSLAKGAVNTADLPVGLTDINLFVEYSNQNLDILESQFKVADGEVVFKGRLEDILRTQLYQLNVTMKNLNPVLLVSAQALSDLEFSGRLNGTGVFNGGGFQIPDFVKNLDGEMSFSILDGKLENFNVLNFVVSKISFIPNLAERVVQAVPQEYSERMRSNKTIFEKIGVRTKIIKGIVSYEASFIADTGSIESKGNLSWKKKFVFTGKFVIPALLAQSLVDDIHDLSTLVDQESGEIIIPLQDFQGPLGMFKPFPDMEYLSKKIIVSKAKDEVRGLLKDIITGGDDGAGEEPLDTSQGDKSQEKSEPDIVDAIFDSIFK